LEIWNKIDDKSLESLKKQKALEEETVKRLTPLYEKLKNPLVKLYMHRIILDTKKHANMYQTLIEMNTRALIGKVNVELMNKELKTHIEEENKMLKGAIEISSMIKDEVFKKAFDRIVKDERQHHKILSELSGILKKEGEDWNKYFYEIMQDFP